jgi:hypothetical protein
MLGFERIEALELNESVVIGDIKITPLRALEDLIDCLFLIGQGGLKVLNVVDAGIDAAMRTRLKRIAPFDVVLWPFQILRERDILLADPAEKSFEARHAAQLQQLVDFKPRIVVPSSCQFIHEKGSWYNRIKFPISYSRFQRDVEKKSPRIRVEQILPGDTWTLTPRTFAKSGRLSWVRRLTEKAVDYKFEPSKTVPTTREIAMKRPVISAENTRRVLSFCRDELASLLKRDKLRNGKGAHSFWQLSLFDHRGHEIKFVYRFQGGRARHVPIPAFEIDYRTEIPLERLAFVLDGGPAYMAYARIFNGPQDVFEDHLISAFSRDMLAYQNGQLRRLLRPTRAR